MEKPKSYDPISKLAGEISERPEAADRVEALIRDSWMVRMMLKNRNRVGITQREIARRMGCSPSRISKIESGTDHRLGWVEVHSYFNALGINLSIMLDQPSLPAATRIKQHVFAVAEQLEALTILAGQLDDDRELCGGIDKFYREVLFNFIAKFKDKYDEFTSIVKLPNFLDEIDRPAALKPSVRKSASTTPPDKMMSQEQLKRVAEPMDD
jgi:transcriptional regulator with XRE-family HTH domain